jgi:UDP-glucose 4-epimerase
MLAHLNDTPKDPARVVILGAHGFVGAATERLLRAHGVPVLGLARADLDLLSPNAGKLLAQEIRADDSVVVISAKAPVKDASMLVENVRMMENVCAALTTAPPHHVVYISSDAVYRDSKTPLTEQSCAEPGSLAILRPSLLYGTDDPHNGYGPNRFRRLAAAGKEIVLFGDGEERRDHVLIDDVAELIFRVLTRRSSGVLNIATGNVISFRDIAEQISRMVVPPVPVRGSPRSGPMPHDGYRPFEIAGCRTAFPDFRYVSLADGLKKVGLMDKSSGQF